MKPIKHIALAAFLTLAAFTTVTYTSCKKDPCKDVACQNNGTCSDGKCVCPSGYEGDKCQTPAAKKFIGAWTGFFTCDGEPETNATMAFVPGATPTEIIWVFEDYKIKGNITGSNTVSFPSQAPDPAYKDEKISATMTLNGSAADFSFSWEFFDINGQAETSTCSATLLK